MKNHGKIKYPRGSSPMIKQGEEELHDHEKEMTSDNQHSDTSSYRKRANRKLTKVQSLPEDREDTSRWQDDGGESD